MSGSGLMALTDVREWSGGPHGCLEPLPDVREWFGGPPGYPGVVGSPSRMSGSGREALPNVWEWLGGPPGCPGVV